MALVIGNGSTSVKSLLASQHKLAVNIKLLQDLGLDDIELDVQPESLKLWAKMAVRQYGYGSLSPINLEVEGHRIIELGKWSTMKSKKAVTDTRDENQLAEATAIEASDDITDWSLTQEKKKAKTKSER